MRERQDYHLVLRDLLREREAALSVAELFHCTPAQVRAGEVNTLCSLTACCSRRFLVSSSQSTVTSQATGDGLRRERCTVPSGECACVHKAAPPPPLSLCLPALYCATRPLPPPRPSPLLGRGKVGPCAVGRWPLFVTPRGEKSQRQHQQVGRYSEILSQAVFSLASAL